MSFMNEQQSDAEVTAGQKKQVQALTGADMDQIKYNEIGWTSRVYVVSGGRFVVKFPRKERVKSEYKQEVKIYKLLEQIDTDIQVPKLRWSHPDNEYLGYEGIVGVEFDSVSGTITTDHQRTIGHSIGIFLKQLHQLTLDEPHVMTVDDEIAQFQAKYEASLSVIRQEFSKDEQTKVSAFIYNDMPENMRQLGSDPALCHGDLGYWNIILKEDGKIGIIDFGDVGYYDRAKDFCGLQDATMLNAAIEAYGDSELLRQRIAIRQKAIPFLDLQYYAEGKDMAKIQETIEAIKVGLALYER
jgi:aminoglycoside phosphotransferase